MYEFKAPHSIGLPPKAKPKVANSPAADEEDDVPLDAAAIEQLKKQVDQFLSDHPEYLADQDGLYKTDVPSLPDAHLSSLFAAHYIDPFTVPIEHWLQQSEQGDNNIGE